MRDQPSWHPEVFEKKRENLIKRNKIIAAIRHYFDGDGFMAVDTPALQVCPGIELHLKAFKTELNVPHLDIAKPYYLHTSPEFAMKKLLVAGLAKIYQICHVYRNEAKSDLHLPEFMMIEWYRVGEDLNYIMQDCEAMIQQAASAIEVQKIEQCDLFGAWERISVYEAFEKYTGIDITPAFKNPHAPSVVCFQNYAKILDIRAAQDDRWDDIFFKIFLAYIEPKLGRDVPTFLTDYPIAMAALSKAKVGAPGLAQRFELYINGVELANAFGELTDPDEQLKRFKADLKLKAELYGDHYAVDEDFIEALRYGMPDASGIALGIDRLVMLLTDVAHIDDVNFLT